MLRRTGAEAERAPRLASAYKAGSAQCWARPTLPRRVTHTSNMRHAALFVSLHQALLVTPDEDIDSGASASGARSSPIGHSRGSPISGGGAAATGPSAGSAAAGGGMVGGGGGGGGVCYYTVQEQTCGTVTHMAPEALKKSEWCLPAVCVHCLPPCVWQAME